ncbi:MAG TPA: hypothetical protein VD928_03420 [Candidatus Paceibacterota bacterium]|nr:hypothetical protein [Candidatus Paceibacterota bacterium]
MNDLPFHAIDGVLQAHILTDEHLKEAESLHAGSIRLISHGRYNARLKVGKEVWKFSISEDALEFTATGGDRRGDPIQRHLAFHRAAEAILGLRRGHSEYRESDNKRRKRRFHVV